MLELKALTGLQELGLAGCFKLTALPRSWPHREAQRSWPHREAQAHKGKAQLGQEMEQRMVGMARCKQQLHDSRCAPAPVSVSVFASVSAVRAF